MRKFKSNGSSLHIVGLGRQRLQLKMQAPQMEMKVVLQIIEGMLVTMQMDNKWFQTLINKAVKVNRLL
jgi:hypothetical protein